VSKIIDFIFDRIIYPSIEVFLDSMDKGGIKGHLRALLILFLLNYTAMMICALPFYALHYLGWLGF